MDGFVDRASKGLFRTNMLCMLHKGCSSVVS